jgi:hypothetical protein
VCEGVFERLHLRVHLGGLVSLLGRGHITTKRSIFEAVCVAAGTVAEMRRGSSSTRECGQGLVAHVIEAAGVRANSFFKFQPKRVMLLFDMCLTACRDGTCTPYGAYAGGPNTRYRTLFLTVGSTGRESTQVTFHSLWRSSLAVPKVHRRTMSPVLSFSFPRAPLRTHLIVPIHSLFAETYMTLTLHGNARSS